MNTVQRNKLINLLFTLGIVLALILWLASLWVSHYEATKPPVTISSADLYQQQSLVRQQLRSNWDLLTPEEQTSSCNQYKTDTKGYVDGLFLGSNGFKESPVLTKKLVNDFFWSVCYRNE